MDTGDGSGAADDQTPAAPEHSFDELMLAYLGQVTPVKRAGERDRYSAKQLYPVFSGRVMESLRAADARAYVAKRQAAGAAAGTINKEVGLMSAALNWARRELEWEVPNPFQGRRLREPPGRTRWLTRAEALLRAAEANKRAPHLTDFIRLALYTVCGRGRSSASSGYASTSRPLSCTWRPMTKRTQRCEACL